MNKKEKLLEDLKRLVNKLGRKPSNREINRCPYTKTSGAYKWYFGNVDNALELIGSKFVKQNLRIKYSNDDIITEFYRVKSLLGYVPSYEDMIKYAKYHPCIIQDRYKSWNKFLNLLNEKHVHRFEPTFLGKRRCFLAEDGHKCYSKREVEIDNLFYHLGIEHSTEVLYPYDEKYNANTRKRSDWKIGNIYVEYCGLLDFYKKNVREKYQTLLEEKINLCMRNDLNFLHITPDSIKNIEKDVISFIRGD